MKPFMRLTGITVFLLSLFIPPAGAQMGGPWWTTKSTEVRESDGEVVLTHKFTNGSRPGRARYQTFDWTARAPEDYTALSDAVIFTGSEAMTIRIPVVDDDLAEGSEDFTVRAWEEPPPADPWPPGPNTATVRIIDDDQKQAPASSTSLGRSSQPAAGSQVGSPAGAPSQPPAESSGSTNAANPPVAVNPVEPTAAGEPGAGNEVEPLVVGPRTENRPSSMPRAALGALLLLTIAAGGFGFKKRLEQRSA